MSVIKVENLGKRYIIDHQKQRGRYTYDTLGGALASTGKKIVSYLRSPISSINNQVDHEEFWALKDINFEINQGDRVGIIGRNGAGKSTLLKILSRITAPTTGQIRIKGRVSSLLEVGTGFHPELTGRENIYLNGAILGMKRQEIKAKFDEIVAFAEVEKFLDTPVKHYSSGMYVRLAFAVAAHLEPEILIVDEVLAVGDAQFQKKCLGKMEEVGNDGRTVIYVSHNMQTVQQLCSKVAVLEKGRLKFNGNSAQGIAFYFGGDKKLDLKRTASYKDKKAYLKGIEFLNEKDEAQDSFLQTENIQVKIDFVVQEKIEKFTISMAILHGDGFAVFSEALLDQIKPCPLNIGNYSISFVLKLDFLKLETYFLSVYLVDMEIGEGLDNNDSIPFPEIYNPNSDSFVESRRWGVVRIPVFWNPIVKLREHE